MTDDDINKVREYAKLRYTLTEIAIMVNVPLDEVMLRMQNHSDPFYTAYMGGKLESQQAYREAVLKAAENGEEWASFIIEKWNIKQREEELGCHE